MLELICTVFHESEPKVEVTVRDSAGRIRRVDLTLFSKDGMTLPENWMQMVQGEIDFQDTEEQNRLSGRWIPE